MARASLRGHGRGAGRALRSPTLACDPDAALHSLCSRLCAGKMGAVATDWTDATARNSAAMPGSSQPYRLEEWASIEWRVHSDGDQLMQGTSLPRRESCLASRRIITMTLPCLFFRRNCCFDPVKFLPVFFISSELLMQGACLSSNAVARIGSKAIRAPVG